MFAVRLLWLGVRGDFWMVVALGCCWLCLRWFVWSVTSWLTWVCCCLVLVCLAMFCVLVLWCDYLVVVDCWYCVVLVIYVVFGVVGCWIDILVVCFNSVG